MSFVPVRYVEVKCDLEIADDCSTRLVLGDTESKAEANVLGLQWKKRGWKHICPACQRREAINAQKVKS